MNTKTTPILGNPTIDQDIPWSPHRVYIKRNTTVEVMGKQVPVETVDGKKFYFRCPNGQLLSVETKNWTKIEALL